MSHPADDRVFEAMLRLLYKLEWSGRRQTDDDELSICPVCRRLKGKHDGICELDEAIRALAARVYP